MKLHRTLTLTLSVTVTEDEELNPRIVSALKSYVEQLETGIVGNLANEVMLFGDTRLHAQAQGELLSRVGRI